MSARNWILSRQKCPACDQITTVKSQLHIAASFDGDESGRFCNREYYLGDRISWFNGPDSRQKHWEAGNKKEPDLPGLDTECCYSSCSACHFEGYVIITLEQLKLVSITAIAHLDNWPDSYYL